MKKPAHKNALLSLAVASCSLAAFSAVAAPALYTDPAVTNTVVFRDYNGSSDTNVNYSVVTPVQNVSGGVSTWT